VQAEKLRREGAGVAGAVADLTAIEQVEQAILTESLRRAARVRPWVAMVMAEILEADERDLVRLAHSLAPEDRALRAQPGVSRDCRNGRSRMRVRLVTDIKLNHKQRLYLEGVLGGKSRRQAALAAGYSQKSADNPGYNIERRGRGGRPTMRYFWDVLKPPEKSREPASVGEGGDNNGQFPAQVQPDQ
jgi:hypothetical protein